MTRPRLRQCRRSQPAVAAGWNRLLLGAVLVACCAVVASAASSATSPWAVKADAVCAAWHRKSASLFGAHPKKPTTPKQMFAFLLESRKMETGMLGDLRRIRVPRPPRAVNALAVAAADVKELNTVIGLYGAVSDAEFKRDFLAWAGDDRASRAFVAAGARTCA